MQIRLTTASERYYLNTKLMTDILNMYTGLFFFFLNRGGVAILKGYPFQDLSSLT